MAMDVGIVFTCDGDVWTSDGEPAHCAEQVVGTPDNLLRLPKGWVLHMHEKVPGLINVYCPEHDPKKQKRKSGK